MHVLRWYILLPFTRYADIYFKGLFIIYLISTAAKTGRCYCSTNSQTDYLRFGLVEYCPRHIPSSTWWIQDLKADSPFFEPCTFNQ